MPSILPIKDLKDTSKISMMCKNSDQPIFITKNGYGDMVIMSMSHYEKMFAKLDMYSKLETAENDINSGNFRPAHETVSEIRSKYGV